MSLFEGEKCVIESCPDFPGVLRAAGDILEDEGNWEYVLGDDAEQERLGGTVRVICNPGFQSFLHALAEGWPALIDALVLADYLQGPGDMTVNWDDDSEEMILNYRQHMVKLAPLREALARMG